MSRVRRRVGGAARLTPEEKGTVRYHLHRQLCQPTPGRDLTVIHASDVIDEDGWWCPRQVAIMLRDGIEPRREKHDTARRWVYKVSEVTAAAIVDTLADAGVAVGNWECAACTHVSEFCLRPRECEYCQGSFRFFYRETRITSLYSGISGGLDVLVKLPTEPLVMVTEVKVLQEKDWTQLVMPIGSHRLRTSQYLRLIEESGLPQARYVNTRKALILYAVKGGYGERSDDPQGWGLPDGEFSPFKEYTIERDDSATDRFAERARSLHLWRQDRTLPLPPIEVCDTSTCKRARACGVREACWSE